MSSLDNHGQNILFKFLKLSAIDFPVKCFSAYCLQFSNSTAKIFILCGQLGTCF